MSLDSANSNIVVYTAIFGDYDLLIEPSVVEPNIDYICFTDDETITSDVWEIRNVTPMTDPALSNRRIKILSHQYLPEYDISIYVDGNVRILEPIKPLVKEYLSTTDFALYKHPERTSIIEEAEACIKLNKAEEDSIRKQLNYYSDMGFPDDQGLSENCVLFRRHNSPEIKEVMNSWWCEVSERVSRDQLSLMFVLWENEFKYNQIDHPIRDAPQFVRHLHYPEGYLGVIWPYWLSFIAILPPKFLTKVVFYLEGSISILINQGFLALISEAISLITKNIAREPNNTK